MRLEPKDGYCWFPYSLTLSFTILNKSVAQWLAHGHFSVDTKVWVGSFQNVLENYMLANKNKVEVTDLFLNLSGAVCIPECFYLIDHLLVTFY